MQEILPYSSPDERSAERILLSKVRASSAPHSAADRLKLRERREKEFQVGKVGCQCIGIIRSQSGVQLSGERREGSSALSGVQLDSSGFIGC